MELTINPQTGQKLIKSRSTMFPDDWDWAKIKEEVENAVRYNEGLVTGTRNMYKGKSIDGTIEIHFYYDDITKEIISYFPKI